ncbi:MAG TPA: chromate transporter, partial [Myxococcaceae bacterium]|nr:chromate transporter [Myxococcaceae bacterium]
IVFFKTGLGAYGGGFAIIPTLHSDVVARGWLSEHQFADAVAVGKLTPGPVLLMATFIGFLRSGVSGALIATIAILVAPFLLVVVLARWLNRVRSRRWMRAAFHGLTSAVVGLMVAAALTLGRSMQTGAGLAIAAVVALTLVRFERVNPVVMLALGGISRFVLKAVWGI